MAIRTGCSAYVQYLTKKPEPGEFVGMLQTNKAFKSLVESAVKAIQAASEGAENPKPADLVESVVAASVKFNELMYAGVKPEPKQKRWLHPSTILYWLANLATTLTSEISNTTMPWKVDAESATMLSAFIQYYCVPNAHLRYWSKLEQAVRQRGIFPFSRSVYAMPAPKTPVARGYQLTELTLNVPLGAKLWEIATDRPKVVGPKQIGEVKINLLDPRVKDKLGEVWIVVSNDGRHVTFASSLKPTLSMFDLLKEVATLYPAKVVDVADYPLAINDPAKVPNRKLPDAFSAALLRSKQQRDTTGSVAIK